MKSENQEIFEAASLALKQGARLCLASVVETYGSSPRPVGSILVVSDDGRFWGSVSGGCIEEELLEQLKLCFPCSSEFRVYGADAKEQQRLQLPCGGQLRLFLQPLEQLLLDELIARFERREIIALHSSTVGAEYELSAAGAFEQAALEGDVWRNVFGPKWRMLVVGAGPIARFLVEMAASVDIGAVMIDPRPDYNQSWDESLAPLMSIYPDDAIEELGLDAHTFVVALSHDPKLDDLAIIRALHSDAAYVGAMGSARTSKTRRQRLREHFGFDEPALAKLHAPIGLDIGSKTPAEIAVSILADLISVKNAKRHE